MKTAYRFSLSIDEAQAIVRPLLSEIQEHKGHIAAVLASHADDLMARWSKKGRFGTPQKRQDLLKTVAPDLPESSVFFLHWGYYLYWERKDIMSRSPHFQHKVLLPWLTVDLLKTHPDALFALLHNRTVHGPEEWAAFDYQQLTKHFQNGDFDTDWSSKAMVMHVSRWMERTNPHRPPPLWFNLSTPYLSPYTSSLSTGANMNLLLRPSLALHSVHYII